MRKLGNAKADLKNVQENRKSRSDREPRCMDSRRGALGVVTVDFVPKTSTREWRGDFSRVGGSVSRELSRVLCDSNLRIIL